MSTPEDPLAAYLAFARDHPRLFDNSDGGVRVLLDPEERNRAGEAVARRLESRGQPTHWALPGLYYEDAYIWVTRDLVEFLDGTPGVHHRVIRKAPDTSGVGVLGLLEGKAVLVRHYRHATRCWHLEIPRGGINPGQSPEDAVHMEVAEEIGGRVRNLVPLGPFVPTTSLMHNDMRLFFGEFERVSRPALDEGIGGVLEVEVSELERMIRDGEISDSTTLAAFLQARLRGLV